MTGDLVVKPGAAIDHGWEFRVSIAGFRYTIQLTQEYWVKLTHRRIAPVALVQLALEYVRQHHRFDSLPGNFSLEYLDTLVVDFERHVRAAAQAEAAANPR